MTSETFLSLVESPKNQRKKPVEPWYIYNSTSNHIFKKRIPGYDGWNIFKSGRITEEPWQKPVEPWQKPVEPWQKPVEPWQKPVESPRTLDYLIIFRYIQDYY